MARLLKRFRLRLPRVTSDTGERGEEGEMRGLSTAPGSKVLSTALCSEDLLGLPSGKEDLLSTASCSEDLLCLASVNEDLLRRPS